MKTKIAYISGPITGLLNGNFDAFMLAQRKLETEGYICVNPHEINREIYDKWEKIQKPDNNVLLQNHENEMWCEFMKSDIQHLVKCDCVFLLDNYETSRGCRLEIVIAQKLNIPIYYMRDYKLFDITFDIKKQERVPV